ncbi:RNA polymerase sigma-70 factor, ECF subfamily [Pustulibacterium marinum]|uniref:RNA polymerase sigma factor n=1 Tax=Pustulibacterium marinum TaxID=1224947 RepID=A0A1I7FT31_9FLAO|nr:sigma-70 family RNA polymerase sigma factor [Pustulibacterium marinum]SFU39308.1 RNA polymerase sigma-70 factor, ECF subfamily [Pustulibacterium marinum]
MTQEQLIILIKKKDPKSFDYLYDMYADNLFGIIHNVVKDKEESEDVLQEVFVKIWNNLDSYDTSKGRFFTWILNIARNTAIDKYRSKSYNNSRKNLSTDNFVHIITGSYNMNAKTDAIGIKNFINKLKPTCIKIIDLLFFKGFTQKETAEELEIPLGTVKTRNRACINELRNMLDS